MRSSKQASGEHLKLVESEVFDRAITTTLLEYQRVLVLRRGDGNIAAANHYCSVGALEFVNLLKTLVDEPPQIERPAPTGNLTHAPSTLKR